MLKKITISILAIFLLTLPSYALRTSRDKSKLSVMSAVTIADTSDDEISVVTSDSCFVRVCISSKTSITQSGTNMKAAQIRKGYKITCKGRWENGSNGVFNAAYIFIGKTVTNADVMDRVASACSKISEKNVVLSSTGSQNPHAQVQKPQLEVTQWHYIKDKACLIIEGEVKSLIDRPIIKLTATIDYYTKTDKYLFSSVIAPKGYSRSRLDPGDETFLSTEMIEVTPNDFPDPPVKCIVTFSSLNMGDLVTSPRELKLDAH